jgi:hypothetical protein
LVIVERVQHHFDGIVVKHVFPPGEPGANLVWVAVVTDEDGVQVLVVIAEIGLGAL